MYTEGCVGALVGEMGEERKALVRRVREVEIRPHSLLCSERVISFKPEQYII